jgi:hypothetical protein
MRLPIGIAKHDIDDYFDVTDLALDRLGLHEAAVKPEIFNALSNALFKLGRIAMITGFNAGGRLVGKTAGSAYIAQANRMAMNRAREVAEQMRDTSLKWLKADPHSTFALSVDRADRAAKNEAAFGYYTGLQQALWGEGATKEWVCLGDDPCEDCQDNEDEGPIAMEQMFQSGDYAPLAHLNCMCTLEVHGPEEGLQ